MLLIGWRISNSGIDYRADTIEYFTEEGHSTDPNTLLNHMFDRFDLQFEQVSRKSQLNLDRGGLTLWALVQCPGVNHFSGPTNTIHANLRRAQIAAKIAFARGPKGVSVRP